MSSFVHYQARARSHAFGKSPVKGTPFVSVQFEPVEGPPSIRGKWFEWRGWLVPGSIVRTVRQLKLAGATLPGGDISDLSGLGSTVVDISVEETERGPRVAFVNAADPRLSDDERKALATELSAAVLSAEDEPAEDDSPL